MPLILHSRDYDRWLDRGDAERLSLDLLGPYESEETEVYEANSQVNNKREYWPDLRGVAAKAAADGDQPYQPG